MTGPTIDELEARADVASLSDFGSDEASWLTVDANIKEMVAELDAAVSIDDVQDVGRRCREITIAAANLVFDPAMVPTGGDMPGPNDAVARIEHYLNARVGGPPNARLRGLVRKQIELAHQVTHVLVSIGFRHSRRPSHRVDCSHTTGGRAPHGWCQSEVAADSRGSSRRLILEVGKCRLISTGRRPA